MLLAAAGFAGLQGWTAHLTEVQRSLPQVMGGLGFGLVIAPLGAVVLQRVPEANRATASAWLTLARVTGMLVGAAALTSTGLGRFYARASQATFGSPEFARIVQEAQVTTFREVFIAGALVMLVAGAVACAIGGRRPSGGAEDVDPWWTLM